MSEKTYDNGIKTVGLQIVVAAPVDDRLIIDTEAQLVELFNSPETEDKVNLQVVLYDMIIILTRDSKKKYIWMESVEGLIDGGYKYPAYLQNEEGQDYGDKTYNFVLYTPVNKITKVYTDNSNPWILVENNLLPEAILQNKAAAMVMMKSDATGYTRMEFPDSLVVVSAGINIVFDPEPDLNETFLITLL